MIDPPQAAALNMGIDQALLDSVSAGGPATLRFYQWDRPTLSLGYFQSLSQRMVHDASTEIGVVRRSTGGGAIVHHHELTYSLTLPILNRSVRYLRTFYQLVHEALQVSLAGWQVKVASVLESGELPLRQSGEEPFLCFQRRAEDDLVLSGYKILGSAQRRSGRAVLQHGSLLLRVSPFAPELPGLEDLIGRALPVDDLILAWREEIADRFQQVSVWRGGALNDAERRAADRWQTRRFAASEWLRRRP